MKMSQILVVKDYQVARTGMNRLCLSFACEDSAPGAARFVMDPGNREARLFRDDKSVFVFPDFPTEHVDEIALCGGVLVAEREPPRPVEAARFPYVPAGFSPVRRFYEAAAALLPAAAQGRSAL